MSKIFSDSGKPLMFLSKLFDILILSMIFMVCCIPIITIGPALCALYYTYRKVISQRKGYLVRTFFLCFKNNFLQSFVSWLILLAVVCLMIFNLFYTATAISSGTIKVVLFAIYFFIVFLCVILTGYIFPLLSRFECTVKNLFKSAVGIAVENPGTTLGVFLSTGVFYALTVYSMAAMPIFIFVLPVFYAYIMSLILERKFEKYIDKNKE